MYDSVAVIILYAYSYAGNIHCIGESGGHLACGGVIGSESSHNSKATDVISTHSQGLNS